MSRAWVLVRGGLRAGKLAEQRPREDKRRLRRGEGSRPWVSPACCAAIREHRAAGLEPGEIAARLGLQLSTVLAVLDSTADQPATAPSRSRNFKESS